MIIALKHTQHGFHYAYNENEAKACEAAGWTRIECDQHGNHVGVAVEAVIQEQPPEVRRGRPRKDVTI